MKRLPEKHHPTAERQFILLVSVLLLFIMCTGLTSCVSTPTKRRGSLSDAMDKARDDYQGDRNVPSEDRDPDPFRDDRDDDGTGGSAVYTGAGLDPLEVWIGLKGGSADETWGDIRTYFDADIALGAVVSDPLELDFYAGIKAAYPFPGSSLDESVKDPLLFFKAGVEARLTPFPRLPVFSPFIFAGMGGFYMFWAFENPINPGTENITGDSIGGMILSAGAGIYPVRLKRFRVGLSVVPEIYLFGPVTQEGFDNDYFSAYSTVKFQGEVSVQL